MTEIDVEINGDSVEKLKKHLTKVKGDLKDLKHPLQKVTVALDRWVQKNFKGEGVNVGGWKPFARGGRINGDKIDTSAKLLQDTGRLRASFIPFADKNKAGIGSALSYSIKHEKGIEVPQRRMLPTKKEFEPTADKILNEEVKSILKDKKL